MEQYFRAYLIGPDGHVAGVVEIICENEAMARERAKQLALDCTVELWQGPRRIEVFQPPQ